MVDACFKFGIILFSFFHEFDKLLFIEIECAKVLNSSKENQRKSNFISIGTFMILEMKEKRVCFVNWGFRNLCLDFGWLEYGFLDSFVQVFKDRCPTINKWGLNRTFAYHPLKFNGGGQSLLKFCLTLCWCVLSDFENFTFHHPDVCPVDWVCLLSLLACLTKTELRFLTSCLQLLGSLFRSLFNVREFIEDHQDWP